MLSTTILNSDSNTSETLSPPDADVSKYLVEEEGLCDAQNIKKKLAYV
jgi:hypothetical protein